MLSSFSAKKQVRVSILACFLLAMEEIVEEGFNQGALRIQLEVCRLANMSVAASLASQNALGVACKDI